MKIEKVLACVGVLALALSLALLTQMLIPRPLAALGLMMTSFLFAMYCFAFIWIGRVAPPILKKLHQVWAERDGVGSRHMSAHDKYADAKIDVPDVR